MASAFVEMSGKAMEKSLKGEENIDTINSESIHLQKMKPPSFSGNIRLFARFKADFMMIIENKYSDKLHQAYIMKENCLHGDAKKIVENLNDIDKIWERLHDRYGDNIEIVNIVLKEIEQLTFAKTNLDQGLVNLVDVLEKSIQDLEIVGAKDEITNAYTVKLIEMKLPKRILAKWFEKEERKEGDDGKIRFERLFKFLIEERRQTERLMQLKPQGESHLSKENSYNPRKGKYLNAAIQNNMENKNRQTINL